MGNPNEPRQHVLNYVRLWARLQARPGARLEESFRSFADLG